MTSRAARMSRAAVLLLLSAAAIRLSFPPFDLAPFMLVAWCPFLAVVHQCPWRWAMTLGALHGLGLGLSAHGWIPQALIANLSVPTWQAWAALSAVAASVAARCAVVGAAVALASARGVPLWISFPIFQVGAELAIPGFFPWTNALATHSMPLWAQLARIGGSAIVSLWICLVNALILQAILVFIERRDATHVARPVLGVLGTLLVVAAYGAWSIRRDTERRDAAPRLALALGHHVSTTAHDNGVPTLRNLAIAHESNQQPDLLVWPETTSPEPIRLSSILALTRDYWRRDRQRPPSTPRLRSLLLLGAVVEDEGALENSALLVDSSGQLLGRYTKMNLLPVGETGLPLPGTLGRSASSFRAGAEGRTLSVGGHTLAISICFEDILAEAVRSEVVRTDAALLVNITSDRWFKDTSAIDFHFALAKLRAVEHGKYLVRSTRDGITGVVDSTGRVVARAEGKHSTIVPADVPLMVGLSPYTWLSPWLHASCLASAAALLLHAFVRRPAPA